MENFECYLSLSYGNFRNKNSQGNEHEDLYLEADKIQQIKSVKELHEFIQNYKNITSMY